MKNWRINEDVASAAEADAESTALAARLKPCPFKATALSVGTADVAGMDAEEAGR
jgi:hypothetical protein